jgi:hypothetical protein
MREDQDGQLDPSRVSIAADPDGGKLNEGDIYYSLYFRFDATVVFWEWERSDPGSKISAEPLALQTVRPESNRSSLPDPYVITGRKLARASASRRSFARLVGNPGERAQSTPIHRLQEPGKWGVE